jgi:ribosome-binding protein aMBF1 (putative translation factor)
MEEEAVCQTSDTDHPQDRSARVSDDLLTAVFSVMGKRGLSNKKLAAEIGISHGSIANWLSRESPISPAWVEAVQTWLEKQAC